MTSASSSYWMTHVLGSWYKINLLVGCFCCYDLIADFMTVSFWSLWWSTHSREMTEKLSSKFGDWAATGFSLKRCLQRTQGIYAQEIVSKVHSAQEARRGLRALWKPRSSLFTRNRHSMKRSDRYYKSIQQVSKTGMETLLADVSLMNEFFQDCADITL